MLEHVCYEPLSLKNCRSIWKISPALAGTRRACRAGGKSHLRVYTRDMFSSEILWGSKDKNFLGHFSLGIFIQDNLPVNLKPQSLTYFSVAVRNGTEKNDQFSRSKCYTSSNMQAAAFAVLSMQGQTMLKVRGNLNNGASGSMKLNS